jgi:hypothetical protein
MLSKLVEKDWSVGTGGSGVVASSFLQDTWNRQATAIPNIILFIFIIYDTVFEIIIAALYM